jgi:hypothetical protein
MNDRMPEEEVDAVLSSLSEKRRADRTQACPDERTWLAVAGGTLTEQSPESLLKHASECAYCATLLKEAIADFSDDPIPGQEFTGKRFAAAARTELPAARPDPNPIARWLALAAGLVLLVVAGRFGISYFAEQRASSLMAEVEKTARFTPFRFTDAQYAPAHLTRARSSDVPLSALNAGQWIAWAGQRAETNVLRARIAIAQGTLSNEPERLEQAAKDSGSQPALLNDVAAALATRAERDRDQKSAEKALQVVDQALVASPSFPEALFNRALILNLLNRPTQACAALAAYRAVEKDVRWVDEASTRIVCN